MCSDAGSFAYLLYMLTLTSLAFIGFVAIVLWLHRS